MKPPVQRARILQALVQVMLPGDDDFPSGAAVGVQGKLADRLFDQEGEKTLDEVLDALAGLADAAPGEPQRAIVAGFEASRARSSSRWSAASPTSPTTRARSCRKRSAASASPTTRHRCRRATAFGGFDMATDRPTHGRGHYVPTDQVKRVDLSGLDIQELRHGQ